MLKVKIMRESYQTYGVYVKPYWFNPWHWKRKFYVNATCLANAINKANSSLDDYSLGRTQVTWKR